MKKMIWICLMAAVGATGCASKKWKSPFASSGFLSSRDLAKRKEADVEKGRLRDLVPPSSERPGDEDYRIGPGDKMQIDVSKRPELTNLYVVTDGGFIVFPLLGQFPVSGLTVADLKANLEQALSRYVRQPVVTVTVTEFASQQVIVYGSLAEFGTIGEGFHVKQMGVYNLKKPTRLLPFLASLGGPRSDADLTNIMIIHKDGTKDVVNFTRVLQDGDMRANVFVQGGDTVIVPSTVDGKNKFLVLGAVKTPGIYSFKEELTALEAVTIAGSFVRASKPEKSFIIRTNVEDPFMIRVDLKRILTRGETQRDIYLKKGDIVFVPPNTIAKWNQAMNDLYPTLQVLQYATSLFIDADAIGQIFDRGFGEADFGVASDSSAEQAATRTVLTTPRPFTSTATTTTAQ